MKEIDRAFARRGLVRQGRAERQLHATHEAMKAWLTPVVFEWKGAKVRGYPSDAIVDLHNRLWPRCPWAAKDRCEIDRSRKS